MRLLALAGLWAVGLIVSIFAILTIFDSIAAGSPGAGLSFQIGTAMLVGGMLLIGLAAVLAVLLDVRKQLDRIGEKGGGTTHAAGATFGAGITPDKRGLRIVAIEDDSLAERWGFRVGDVITHANEFHLANSATPVERFQSVVAGGDASIVILRDGRETEIEVTPLPRL